MNTTNTKSDTATVQQVVGTFESDLASTDRVRAEALEGLQQLRAAKANHLERERIRLVNRLGAEHPRVLELNPVIASNQQLTRALTLEIDRTDTEAPAVDKESWVLYGFVRNQDFEGQPKLTVAFFDRSGRWVEVLGHSCTDSRGYFQLRYERSTESFTDAIAANVRSEMFIHVSDQEQKVLYYDERPVTLKLGQVEYREIILKVADAPCAPPLTPESIGAPAGSSGADSLAKSSKPSSRPRRKSPGKSKPS
jgi:hypothetical protein